MLGIDAFKGVDAELYVPLESIEDYKNATGWKEFKEIKRIRRNFIMNNLEVIQSYEALMDKVEESLGHSFRAKGLHLDTLNYKNIVCIELINETSFDVYTLEIEKV